MAEGLRELRVNAVELLRQPGSTRHVDAQVSGEALDVVHDALAGDVSVDVHLEALNDGITVRGTVSAPWDSFCRRCLRPVDGVATVAVDELYQIELTDEDAYQIENNQLDLAPMTRETVLLELDGERLCTDACAGLCPACGIDRNVDSCECDTTVTDNRWAALEGLKLDD